MMNMLYWVAGGTTLILQESCGFQHEYQVLEIPIPEALPERFGLRDRATGELLPVQRSRRHPDRGFVALTLAPDQRRELEPVPGSAPESALADPVRFDGSVLSNGRCTLKLAEAGPLTGHFPCGPVRGLRYADGDWFGTTRFDLAEPLRELRRYEVESGPLRRVIRFEALGDAPGPVYVLELTLDAGQLLAELDETFSGGANDQLVWYFPPAPRGYRLDTTPGYRTLYLDYALDREVAVLGNWSQFSQLNYDDGFAFRLHDGTICGAVTLRGGEWRGNRRNQLSWALRRLYPEDPASRRLVPARIKADAIPEEPGERVPARDRCGTVPRLCWEGEIGSGRRIWGLLLCDEPAFRPAAGDDASWDGPPPELSHFEQHPDRKSFQRRQGLLRRLFIQRGLFPLQEQVRHAFVWPEEDYATLPELPEPPDSPFWRMLLNHAQPLDAAALRRHLLEFLRCRTEIFWYGAGAISTNVVVSRPVGPLALWFVELCRRGLIPPEERRELRRRFATLAVLVSLPNYYPGTSAMTPGTDPEAMDPGLRGMANQNFYTDAINLSGLVGCALPGHPEAASWRQLFVRQFQRQLEFHVNPASGVWEESHTYFQHVLLTVGLLLRLLRRRGEHDFFRDARLQRLLAGAIRQRTPRDRRFHDSRHLLPFGDHGAAPELYCPLWAFYAESLAATAPETAAQLAWFARECGFRGASAIPPQAPEPVSEQLAGLGIFFRDQDPETGETLLALRSGSIWGHHHNDDGSFWLYGAGRCLVGDADEGEVRAGELKFRDQGHSRRTLEGGGILNYLWRSHRGWPLAVELGGELEYATVFSPCTLRQLEDQKLPLSQPFLCFRTVVKLSATRYLILDSTPQAVATETNFHINGDRVELTPTGGVRAWYPDLELCLTPLFHSRLELIPGREGETHRLRSHHQGRRNYAAYLLAFGRSVPEIELRSDGIDCAVDDGGEGFRLRAEPGGFRLVRRGSERCFLHHREG